VGIGIPEILEAIVSRVPAPQPNVHLPLRALIFDSYYDAYRGVVIHPPHLRRHRRGNAPAFGATIHRRRLARRLRLQGLVRRRHLPYPPLLRQLFRRLLRRKILRHARLLGLHRKIHHLVRLLFLQFHLRLCHFSHRSRQNRRRLLRHLACARFTATVPLRAMQSCA